MASAQVDTLIATHRIDAELLRVADFPEYLKVRREALCELIGAAMGKRVIRDIVVEDGVEHGSEDPTQFEPEPEEALDVAEGEDI